MKAIKFILIPLLLSTLPLCSCRHPTLKSRALDQQAPVIIDGYLGCSESELVARLGPPREANILRSGELTGEMDSVLLARLKHLKPKSFKQLFYEGNDYKLFIVMAKLGERWIVVSDIRLAKGLSM